MVSTNSYSSKSSFEVIFHGTGSSSSLPNIVCLTSKPITCETCASALTLEGQKNKRRNTGAIIRLRGYGSSNLSSEHVLVIDIGKDFRSAALELLPKHDLRRIDAVLLTHGHADAINGLDDLRTWTFGKNRIQDHIDVYLSAETLEVVTRAFPYLFSKEHATGSGNVVAFKWHVIDENKPFKIEEIGIDITPLAVHQGQQASHKRSTLAKENTAAKATPEPYLCLGFMFSDALVYMSDVSHIPEEVWSVIKERSASFEAFVVDCLLLEPHISHFGIKKVVESAKRINAQRTYVVGFGHEIPHDGWDTICRNVGGEEVGEVRLLVRSALEKVSDLGVGIEEGLWIRPAYDGQHLMLGK